MLFRSDDHQAKRQSAGPFHDLTTRLRWLEEQMQYLKRDVQILQNDTPNRTYSAQSSSSYSWDPIKDTSYTDHALNLSKIINGGTLQPLTTSQISAITAPNTLHPTMAPLTISQLTNLDLFSNTMADSNGTT